jgi:hypothetical protein
MAKILVSLSAAEQQPEVKTSESRTRRTFKVETTRGKKVEKVTLAELAKEVHAEHLEGEAYTHPRAVFGILSEKFKKYSSDPTTAGASSRADLVKAVFDEIMSLYKKGHKAPRKSKK